MNAPAKAEFRHIGTRPIRPDGAEKVTGKAIYGPDFVAPGMLHGAILRSPHAHAHIRGIDISKAAALSGVKAIVTGADFPDLRSETIAVGEGPGDLVHTARKCMALEKVLFEGHPVAAVAATSAAIAEEAIRLIEVDYEPLPVVTDIEAAMAPDAPLLHPDIFTSGIKPKPEAPSNIAKRSEQARGDPAAAMAEAAVVVAARYRVPAVHQGYIEPHACVVSWNADGQAQIWSSSQGQFMVRSLTASILGISQADIRAMPLEIGGGFGGKTTVYLEPVAMLLSRKSGRPVRLAMSRADVFRATGPAPGAIVDLKLGASADGKLIAAEIEMKYQSGAFPGTALYAALASAVGHYKLDHFRLVGWNILTNMPATHAYRAPSAPQINFAVESAMDEIAEKLGLDPIELRLKNCAEPGDPDLYGSPMGEIGYVECLEAARAHPHWSAPLGPDQGRGVAAGYWSNYGGPSTAAVTLAEDGTVMVVSGNPDIGGSRASLAIMAAETLEIPYEKVRCIVADTSSIGFSGVTGGSRVTFATGKAVVEAAVEVIGQLKRRAAGIWGVEPDQVGWRNGQATCLAPGKTDQHLSMREIAAKTAFTGAPISAEVSVNAMNWLPGYAVHICDSEVDPETGIIRIVRYTTVQDVGRAIHADYVEGQMQGGAVQGIGWALNEAYLYDDEGRLDNPGFLDYRIPVCSDLPMIDTVMVEKPNPAHPYGVKGVGEVPIVPPLAAVANSASRATGVRLRDLPLAPDKVYAALGKRA